MAFRFCRHHKFQPFFLRSLFIAGQNFHLIATIQFLAHGYKLMIYFRSDTGVSDLGVNVIGKIKGGSAFRQCPHKTFRSEYPDFFCKKVEFEFI